MGIEWRASLAIGVEEIDNQHKELLQRFNQLLSACEASKGSGELIGLIGFLDEYVEQHFSDEEAIQRRYDFPGYQEHKKEHEYFVKKLQALKDEIKIQGVSVHHVMETNSLLLKWLIQHISKVDTELGRFISSSAVKN
jgi:hemerythrin